MLKNTLKMEENKKNIKYLGLELSPIGRNMLSFLQPLWPFIQYVDFFNSGFQSQLVGPWASFNLENLKSKEDSRKKLHLYLITWKFKR
jgi:hypothetical protein